MSEKAPEPPTRLVYRVPIRYVEVWALVAIFMGWCFALMFFRDIDLKLATVAIVAIAAIGLGLILRSRHVIVDADERNVILCNAAFLCFLREWRRISFDDLEAVKIDVVREQRSVHLQVRLIAKGRPDLVLTQYLDRDDALSEAEKVAKFIGIGLLDTTTATAAMRPPEQVGLSVRDRARLAGPAGLPEFPHDTQLKAETSQEAVRITIPKPSLTWWRYAAVSGGIGLFALVCLMTMLEGAPETGWVILIVAPPLLALLFVAAVLPTVRLATRITTLDVSPVGLRIHERAFLRDRTTVIAADDLAELEVVGASTSEDDGETRAILATERAGEGWLRDFGLTVWIGGAALLARSSSEKLSFGNGLTDEELQWLKAVIEQVLAAGVVGSGEGAGDGDQGTAPAGGDIEPS